MPPALKAIALTDAELAVLRSCVIDGEPPHEIDDAAIHEKLEALGLMSRRVGTTPDGSGVADFWHTNANGEWALRVAERQEKKP